MPPRFFVMAGAVLITAATPFLARAAEFSAPQRSEIETIVREYLLAHPEVLQDAMAELEKKQNAAVAEKGKAAVKQYSQALFMSPRQVTLGNLFGVVFFVVFFVFFCGFCLFVLVVLFLLLLSLFCFFCFFLFVRFLTRNKRKKEKKK